MNNQDLAAKLAALNNGEITPFEEIYNDLKTPIYTIILRITQDTALSEDILQEVFIKLFWSPPKLPIKKPRAYIFQMAHNLAIDSLRKTHPFDSLESIENVEFGSSDDFLARIDIDNAFKALSLQERQIVSLHINGDFKFKEIAVMLKLPLGTVFWKYKKALGRLRDILS